MNTQKSLVIANPCHANWNKMSATEKGRFCASCTKEVVDFRQKSKEDIIEYLENYKGEGQTCGQFSATQIDKVGKNYINSSLYKRIGISLMAFLGVFSFKDAKGQKPKMGKVAIKGDVSYQEYNQQNLKTDVTLFGTVRTSSGDKISGAEIKINSDGNVLAVTRTIANGTFAVQLKVDKSMKALTLYTNTPGHDTKITFIPEPQKERIKVDIVMEEMMMVLGEIAIEVDTLKTDSIIKESILEADTLSKCNNTQVDKTEDTSKVDQTDETFLPIDPQEQDSTNQTLNNVVLIEDKKWLRVFPNPATDNVTIEWLDKDENILEIYDMNQKLIWTAKVRGSKTIFHASDLPSGNYLVKITAVLTGKTETAQLSIVK